MKARRNENIPQLDKEDISIGGCMGFALVFVGLLILCGAVGIAFGVQWGMISIAAIVILTGMFVLRCMKRVARDNRMGDEGDE